MEQTFCQSCAMPLGDDESLYGSNVDESRNIDYCRYCYEDGHFTSNISMEEMIEFCVPHMVKANPNMTEDMARELMQSFFPTLKRWQ